MTAKLNKTLLIREARKALKNAYSPYSRFRVGAAVLTSKGKIYTGANIENASYGLTVCAERVAVFKAVHEDCSRIRALAIATDQERIKYPCGACLQVLAEFVLGKEADILIGNSKRRGFVCYSLSDFLPHPFYFGSR